MLDRDKRIAALELKKAGRGIRHIARELEISRQSVRKILKHGCREAASLERESRIESHVDLVRGLYGTCKGNLVRVHEELPAAIARKFEEARRCEEEIPGEVPEISYPALTSFCRRHGIGAQEKVRAGSYDFGPGEEMQHDTSPHEVEIGGHIVKVECASAVLAFSRMKCAQVYTRFDRFWCKVFLTMALRDFGGAPLRWVIDNTSVVRLRGSGKNAVMVPEMKLFAERFGAKFLCHEIDDPNRKARVENPFRYIERNFYAGRRFDSLADLNRQLAEWCTRDNARFKRHLQAKPIELYQVERLHLQTLPDYIHEPYQLRTCGVDAYGYVTHETNRYSVDDRFLGSRLEIRADKDRVLVLSGREVVCEHERLPDKARQKSTLPQHRHPGRRTLVKDRKPSPQEGVLRAQGTAFAQMVGAIRKQHGGRSALPLRQLHRMYLDYPTENLAAALERALEFGLLDLDRIETMVIKKIRGEYFRLPPLEGGGHGEDEAGDSKATLREVDGDDPDQPGSSGEGAQAQEDPRDPGP